MDAISTPASSLRAAATATHTRDANLLKPPSAHHRPLSATRPSKFAPSSSSLSHSKPLLHLSPPRSPPPIAKSPTPAPPTIHRNASTGYAAALLDAARSDGALLALERDVRRFATAIRDLLADPSVREEMKGRVVRGVAEGGGFDRLLVAMVRMLVGKKRVGMVGEVMDEFARICDELSATAAVVVSSERRMARAELAGIAREVQRASGAARVKVRHLFREGSLNFAV